MKKVHAYKHELKGFQAFLHCDMACMNNNFLPTPQDCNIKEEKKTASPSNPYLCSTFLDMPSQTALQKPQTDLRKTLKQLESTSKNILEVLILLELIK